MIRVEVMLARGAFGVRTASHGMMVAVDLLAPVRRMVARARYALRVGEVVAGPVTLRWNDRGLARPAEVAEVEGQ